MKIMNKKREKWIGNQNNPSKDPPPVITFKRHVLTLNQLWSQEQEYRNHNSYNDSIALQIQLQWDDIILWLSVNNEINSFNVEILWLKNYMG